MKRMKKILKRVFDDVVETLDWLDGLVTATIDFMDDLADEIAEPFIWLIRR